MSNDENQNDENKDNKSFHIEVISDHANSIEKLLSDAHDDSATKDFDFARSNLHELIEDGKDALFKLSQISSSSQHPRSFEVYAKLMDTMVNANKELLNLQEKIRDIKHADSPISEKARTVNQSIFVGSTTELQKMIKDMKSND